MASSWTISRWRDVLEERDMRPTAPARLLTPRWRSLVPHPTQVALSSHDGPRFRICAAGRRSGKTERAKRALVYYALRRSDSIVVAAAPTRLQAKRIYWDDLRALVPPEALDTAKANRGISHSELTIWLANGSRILVVGMDHYEAVEGIGADFAVLDEYAAMKPEAWTQTIRPMLSDPGREGCAWFIGRPRGRNHFFSLVEEFGRNPDAEEWAYYHWRSSELLDPEEIAAARRDLDERAFRQEYDAEFLDQEGAVYYAFDREVHAVRELAYDASRPLDLAFDFNVSPGVAVIAQEQPSPSGDGWVTAVIGEVWIATNSNTLAVCEAIVRDWGPSGRIAQHSGPVRLYGDATGGARGSAKVAGSDWELIRQRLGAVWSDLEDCVPRSNPPERVRVTALNARLRSAAGVVRLYVDHVRCPHVIRDLEGVVWSANGDRIEKVAGGDLTHISDALGYYVVAEHPVLEHVGGRIEL